MAILGKFAELSNDNEVRDISKPLDDKIVSGLCNLIRHNSRKIITLKINPSEDITKSLTTETITGMISRWNYISDLYNQVFGIVKNPKFTYSPDMFKTLESTRDKLTEDYMKLGSYSKLTSNTYPEFKTLMPKIKELSK